MFKKIVRLAPYVISVAVLTGVAALVIHREQVIDWWQLRGYDAPAQIEFLADDTEMTDYARRLFFVNKPALDGKDAFNANCAGVIEEAAVLGCYRGDRQGIHIYNIEDERWHGIEEVTAAHEMLHQAYDRLNESEHEQINQLLLDFYKNGELEQDLADKLRLYESQGDEVLVNEMHSIFGTEVEDLPAELEEYYAQYFENRASVLGFRASSRAAFDDYRAQIAQFDRRLQELKVQIDSNESTLTQRLNELESRRQQLEADLAADRVEEYNAAVPGFNSMVSSYNNLLEQTRRLVTEHNDLVTQRNEVAIKVEDLNAALDSRFTPQ